MQLLLQYVQPHTVHITCARPLNVLKFLGLRFLASEGPDGRTFSSSSALRGVQHVTICTFQFRRPTRYDLHVSIFARAFCRALVVFIKLERVPWFWVRKIEMVWGPRGVASPVPIILLRLINCIAAQPCCCRCL